MSEYRLGQQAAPRPRSYTEMASIHVHRHRVSECDSYRKAIEETSGARVGDTMGGRRPAMGITGGQGWAEVEKEHGNSKAGNM